MNKRAATFLVFILFLAACAPSSPEPTLRPTAPFPSPAKVSEKVVTFTTEDNINLFATQFGEGPVAVILAHMGLAGATQKSWQPFAEYIAGLGYTALTLDFRGCGISEGGLEQKYLIYDINAAVDYLREQGYKKIVCMGASMGGTACLRAAIDNQLDGLVVIASPFNIGTPTSVSPDDFDGLDIPTLFITAEKDPFSSIIDIKVMYAKAVDPKRLIIYPEITEHGTDIFRTKFGTEFRDALVDYLRLIE